jgi:hypothetical protein
LIKNCRGILLKRIDGKIERKISYGREKVQSTFVYSFIIEKAMIASNGTIIPL